jgi:hypothetical protein
MKKPVWDFRIPTIIGIAAIAVSIWVTGMLVQQGTEMVGRASSDVLPEHVTVSNISDTSFTVSFTTKTQAVAAISIKGENLQEIVMFQDTSQNARTIHNIVVSDLSPKSKYMFSILLEGKTYRDGDNPYTVTTGDVIELETNDLSASGSVMLPEGSPASEALVVLSTKNSQTVSSLTNDQGEFTFDLSSLRTKDLTKGIDLAQNEQVTISVYKESLSSTIITTAENISKIPQITLAENYDFSVAEDDSFATISAEFVLPTPNTVTAAVAITYPTAQLSIIDAQPTFRGTAGRGKEVQISLSPSRLTDTVIVDNTGRWQYRPTVSLPQGQNTLTITAQDELGRARTTRTTFSVLPGGSQIAQSATPSATLTPTTPPPTATPTTPITISPTPILTVSPTATPIATLTPTLTPTGVPMVTTTSIPTQPVLSVTPTPPGSFSTILITAVSAILIVTGTTLLFILG